MIELMGSLGGGTWAVDHGPSSPLPQGVSCLQEGLPLLGGAWLVPAPAVTGLEGESAEIWGSGWWN